MAIVNVGEFRRPGVFIKEFDSSVFDAAVAPQGIQTLVIGFSKKGVFNAPVTLTSQQDLEAIYGPIDRNLEKKGSFFHRTISKLLETSPVVALNLLLTDDTLDTVEYKSMSTSSGSVNDVKRNGAYRRFFDVSGFWSRDTEAFLTLTKDNPGANERVLHFTNLSDRPITYFIFKSKRTGFDITLSDWYGAIEKVPTYLHPQDYVSDYMVDVYVVAGDWTNYQNLAVDNKWSRYFGVGGLRKNQALNFVNDQSVTTLKIYEGLSLIPYFRDQSGNNVFIENVINRDTNKTGLFCSYNIDAVETDFRNGLLDVIGNNLAVNSDIQDINFLSYKDTIVENVAFTNTVLDVPGNVLSFGSYYKNDTFDRGALHAEGYVWGVQLTFNDFDSPIPSAPNDFTLSYTIIPGAYVVTGGVKYMLNETLSAITNDFTIEGSEYNATLNGAPVSYHSVITISSNGEFKKYDNKLNSNPIVINGNDIVLNYVNFEVQNDGGTKYIVSGDITNVTIDSNGYVELAELDTPYEGNFINSVTQSRIDYTVTSTGGSITFEFENTASFPDTSNYEQWRRIKTFNDLIANLTGPNSDRMVLVVDELKKSISNMTITDIQTANDVNKSFTINTNLSSGDITEITTNKEGILLYINDNEFIVGLTSLKTKEEFSDGQEGVVAKYSDFYQKFRDGIINTGDFFYENNVNFTSGVTADVEFMDVNGVDYIVFYSTTLSGLSFNANDKIIIPQATINTGQFTISNGIDVAGDLSLGANYWAFEVAENTTSETITGVNTVWMTNLRQYLIMYFDSNENLVVRFSDQALSSNSTLNSVMANQTITIFSQKSNYKQTVEIEYPTGWTHTPNKILVKGSRYTELKKGDFLLAHYDTNELEIGEVPRTLTRIIKKIAWANDPTYVEITTDSKIEITEFNGDAQTLVFTSVEDYINFYNGISLKGFKVRKESQPDGTEERMNQMLNLIQGNQVFGINWEGTNLFNALTNKNAITFRYIVDSFGLGLQANSKQQLMQVSGKRLDCFTIINMPSMKDFKKSSSPSFVNEDGALDVKLIAQGGDPETNPAFTYSFGEGPGVSTAGYFAPYVTVNDNGRPLSFPPASFVATTFLRKHNSVQTNIKPWTIAAGINFGRITGIAALEYEFTPEDIEALNGMKANPIVSKRNRGYAIETENTAQTLISSSLSYIHSREVLIELERELTDMLINFQWRVNTPEVRGEIKFRADQICEKYVNQNGLFNYFNKIDEENNTPDLISNQIGVLDTYVEIGLGMGVIVNNITILRTGAINSGGFL
jgi:hypothetical protein